MQSPTPRPEKPTQEACERPTADAGGPESDARAARRNPLATAASLKLLDRRAQAAREASARREEPARSAPVPRSPTAGEPRRPNESTSIPLANVRRKAANVRRAQLALAAIGLLALVGLFFPWIPAPVPAVVVGVCLFASLYLTHGLLQPMVALADTARAVVLGDHAARAAGADAGEFGDIARAFNALLDDRAAMIAQNSEQQQRLQNDIHHLSTVAAAAAAGDLSARARVQGGTLVKLADELNLTLDNYAQLVHAVRTAAGTMNEALSQAHEMAQHLNQNAVRQGSGIESGNCVLRHVAERTDTVSENAQVAGDSVRRTGETAQEGGRQLSRLLEGMLGVKRSSQGSAAKMKRLGERALEISTIVGAISRISAQTNMLALNAAIEASRAGEHGLGFTVVADEVRKLAEDCEEATKEIARLITAVQAETNEAIVELERQVGQVEQQTQIASDASGSLDRILSVSQQSAKLVAVISEAAHQQAGDAAGLRETILSAGQTTREMQMAAERAVRTLEILVQTAADLSRRVGPYHADGATEGV